ncbi:hypothetical protein [Paraburkholderia caballeronis]|uniref:Uncharacterized protein n=1 Tax=Paraburkholderia caballeronis TaxID=416943 RepID=A0A1H7VR68_9BURK|nr:hypothetical protein [Paraburkholderia caballeronis]PXW15509.1 hypothetical protein C7403_12572 [Paraburkholderia caballeronis]PXW93794.1 hypothetical protein C7407_12572 [Paraburkholderia caballeronis]RAJ89034.1 hypothetical protein C7409_12572 [Paraburkholderia caballeronis]SEE00261.1 hypothetical protein SAMN05445871_4444 [Paraburkholderia caballeronis]SEM11660.1 hypothetical protein SAMN05192542_1272 [Paraburkholderia caballeronis]
MPLHAFGLREHIRELGGRMNCELAFGFATDDAGALVVAEGAPRVRFFEVSFEVGDDVGETTFSFNQWAFEFMRAEWLGIGATSLDATFDRIDAMSDVAFARMLEAVLADTASTRDAPDVEHWAVYDPDAGRWVGAPVCVPVRALTLH